MVRAGQINAPIHPIGRQKRRVACDQRKIGQDIPIGLIRRKIDRAGNPVRSRAGRLIGAALQIDRADAVHSMRVGNPVGQRQCRRAEAVRMAKVIDARGAIDIKAPALAVRVMAGHAGHADGRADLDDAADSICERLEKFHIFVSLDCSLRFQIIG